MPGPEAGKNVPGKDPQQSDTGHGTSAPDQAAGAAPRPPRPAAPEVTTGPGRAAGGSQESAAAAGWTRDLRPLPGGPPQGDPAPGDPPAQPDLDVPDFMKVVEPDGAPTTSPGGLPAGVRRPDVPRAAAGGGSQGDEGRPDDGSPVRRPGAHRPGATRDEAADSGSPARPNVPTWTIPGGDPARIYRPASAGSTPLPEEGSAFPSRRDPAASSADTGYGRSTPTGHPQTGGGGRFESPTQTDIRPVKQKRKMKTWQKWTAGALALLAAAGVGKAAYELGTEDEPKNNTPAATAPSNGTGVFSETTSPATTPATSPSETRSVVAPVTTSSSSAAETTAPTDPDEEQQPIDPTNAGSGGQQPGGQQPGTGTAVTTMSVQQLITGAIQEGAVAETTLKAQHAGTAWDADKKALEKMKMDTDPANLNVISHTNQGVAVLEGKDINNIKPNTTFNHVTTDELKFLATIGGEITPEQMKKLQERYPKSEFVKALADLKDLNYRDADTPKKEIKADDIAAAVNYLKIVNVTTPEQRAALAKAIEKGDLTTIDKIVSASEVNFKAIVVSPAPAATAQAAAAAAGPQKEAPQPEVKPVQAPLLTIEGDTPATVVETVTVDNKTPDLWHEAQELLETHSDLSDEFIQSEAATPLVNSVMAFIEGTNDTNDIPKDRKLKVPTKNVVRLFATTHTHANRPADQTPLYMQSFVRDYKAFGVSIPQGTHQENPKDKTRPFIKDFAARSNIHIKAYETIMQERPGQEIEDIMTQLNLVTEITNYINSLPEDEREQYKAFFDGDVNLTNLVLGTDKNQTDPKLAAIQTEYAKYVSLDRKKATPEDVTTIIMDLLTAVANASN